MGPGWELVIASSREFPGCPVEAKNKQEYTGSDTAPAKRPEVEEWMIDDPVTEHGPDVVDEPPGSVDPADTDALTETEDEQGKVSGVLVHENNPVSTSLGDATQTEDEPHETVGEDDEMLLLTEGGELVNDGSGDGLDDAELAVHSEGYEHEEEEDGPERRDWQEGHSLRVSNEGKTKFCIGEMNSEETMRV